MTSAAEKLKAKVAPTDTAGGPAMTSAEVIRISSASDKPGEANGTIAVPDDVRAEVETQAKEQTERTDAQKMQRAMESLKAGAFEDQFGEFNIRVTIGKRYEVVNIESGAGKDAIRQVVQSETGKLPPKTHIENIQALIRMATRGASKKGLVYQRIASMNGIFLLDLGDQEGRCVRVESGQWDLVQDGNVAFLRGRGYGALPIPVRSDNPKHAFKIIFEWLILLGVIKTKAALVLVALVTWLRAGNTYPILLLYGPPGSGKTVAARLILLLIDPTDALAFPNIRMDSDDIAAAAQHRHILSFDNLSKLSAANQDTLCTCATGGEIHARKLYSARPKTPVF